MAKKTLKAICETDEYKNLVSKRSKTIWPLTILMMLAYFSYILVIAFAPEFFAQKVGDGHTTYGIVFGLGMIFFSFALTGYYTHKANTILEPLTEELHKKVEDLS